MIHRRSSRKNLFAQAAVEAALIMPLLALLALGTYDLSRAFALSAQAEAAARSGLRTAINDPGGDIAHAIYYEPTNLNSNSSLNWGPLDPCNLVAGVCTGPGTGAECTGNGTGSYTCGDADGCYADGAAGEGFWSANPTANACYAQRPVYCASGLYTCQVANPCVGGPSCLQYEGWTDNPCRRTFACQRPPFTACPCANNQTAYGPGTTPYIGIEVVVTFKFKPETGMIAKYFGGSNGALYIRHFAIGYPIYGPADCCGASAAAFGANPP